MNDENDGINIAPSAIGNKEKSAGLKLLKIEEKLTKLIYFKKLQSKNKCSKCGQSKVGSNPANIGICSACT
jgi:hypothetical protein